MTSTVRAESGPAFARAAVVSVGFGMLAIFSKAAYAGGASVATVVAGRSVCMVALLGLFASGVRRAAARAVSRELVAMALLMAFNGVTYFVAISRASAATVTLVIYVYPALVVAAAHMTGRTRVGFTGLAVLGLTLAGVALAVRADGGIDAIALVLALSNALGYAAYLLVCEHALRRADAVTAYALCGGLSGLVLLLGAVAYGEAHGAMGAARGALIAIAGAGLVSTVAASMLQLTALRRLGSAATALVTCLEIATVIGASAALLGDPLTARLVVGAVLVIAGACLAPAALPPRRPSSVPLELGAKP